jgi:ubiquinone/menaquinone biosynthesis C-methylase UbiE
VCEEPSSSRQINFAVGTASAAGARMNMNTRAAAKWIRRLSPKRAKADLSRFVHHTIGEHLKPNVIINALFTPPISDTVIPLVNPRRYTQQSIWRQNWNVRSADQPLPLPPAELRYYKYDATDYLAIGREDALIVRGFLDRLGVRLNGVSVMDWGCRDGRVLRHFADEARVCDFWGVDQHGPTMEWAKQNLSPPFRFVTCTQYPHLPFEDRTFDVIVAISVLTHISLLSDTWLMELRRILKPGGYGLFTVHDEHTWRFLQQNDSKRAIYDIEQQDIAAAEGGDLVVVEGPSLASEYVNVFYSTTRIRREWSQYFEIVSIEPYAYVQQSMVVVKKPIESRAP